MAQHNDYGQICEDRAAAYLMARGYVIRDRNWRLGHKEVDIIAQKDGELVFIEVKSRKSNKYGEAIDAVSDQKIRNIVITANAYVRYHRLDFPIRFDIIGITGEPCNLKVEHIENAFYPPLF